jgi:hypothetical protein
MVLIRPGLFLQDHPFESVWHFRHGSDGNAKHLFDLGIYGHISGVTADGQAWRALAGARVSGTGG